MKNFLQNLGLCRKAGVLEIGFDATIESVKKGKAVGVLIACDISAKTLKEVTFHAEKFKVEIFPVHADMQMIKSILGKPAGVIAVTDRGLLQLMVNKK
ncbi:MAG: ribosomal L7Ae/L30e/S12e/Gadd45 family protein [Oscillospiraceae bacterium]|nr:ribosomal L7Ae/L30e/S12e/Gadd45 family protein [Oscillospiraceae bacterium]